VLFAQPNVFINVQRRPDNGVSSSSTRRLRRRATVDGLRRRRAASRSAEALGGRRCCWDREAAQYQQGTLTRKIRCSSTVGGY